MNPQTSVPTPSVVRHLPRQEYSKDRFRNREEVLKEVDSRIHDLQQDKFVKQTVLLIWGVHGMGKSWILQRLAEDYSYKAPTKRRKGVFAALVSFEDFDPTTDRLSVLLGELVDSMMTSLPEDVVQNSTAFKEFYKLIDAAEVDQNHGKVAEQFVNLVTGLSTNHVPVLLFDALEGLEIEHPKFLNWFEEHVIAPLVRWNQSLVVLASRRELRQLRDFEVRRRVKKLSLDAFPLKEVGRQVGSEAIGELLYPITYGHPLSTWYIQSGLERVRQPGQAFTAEFLKDRRQDIVGLLQDIVEQLLFVDVANMETKDRLMIAATLRSFHIRSLQLLLSAICETPEIKNLSDSEVQRWIGDMTDTNLVRWSLQRSGYEVEVTVRHLINRLGALQNETEYIRRHQEAFDLYRNWIERMPFTSDRYVVEAAYHLGAMVQVRPSKLSEAWADLQRILDQVFPAQHRVDLQRIDTVVQNVHMDDELRETSGELYIRLWEHLSNLREHGIQASDEAWIEEELGEIIAAEPQTTAMPAF